MRKILFAVAFAILASTQAFAIVGVGAHYVMNTGSLDASSGTVKSVEILGETKPITLNQAKADGLKGIGFKAWIDFLPFVDIEGTLNVAATRYQTSLTIPKIKGDPDDPASLTLGDTTINLSYSPDAPYNMIFGEASPLFGVVNGDISVTYPFDLPIIRPYIGLGFSYFASIPIVNASFANKMLNDDLINALTNENDPISAAKAPEEIKKALIKTLEKESYTTGIGGHIIAGLRIKPPIIPVAIYANGKYYFGGNTNKQFSQGFVLEAGGGFAL